MVLNILYQIISLYKYCLHMVPFQMVNTQQTDDAQMLDLTTTHVDDRWSVDQ